MPRNIDHRVETLSPVRDPALIRRLREDVLGAYLRDNVKARHMDSEGVYTRPKAPSAHAAANVQEMLIARRTPSKKKAQHRRPKRG